MFAKSELWNETQNMNEEAECINYYMGGHSTPIVQVMLTKSEIEVRKNLILHLPYIGRCHKTELCN